MYVLIISHGSVIPAYKLPSIFTVIWTQKERTKPKNLFGIQLMLEAFSLILLEIWQFKQEFTKRF